MIDQLPAMMRCRVCGSSGCPRQQCGDTTFLRAKTANKVLNAQERQIRFAELKGEFVDRAREER